MAVLISTKCTLRPGPKNPFHVLAKKYCTELSDKNLDGFTLVFLHAVGMHKETWEVIIERLFDLNKASVGNIRDVFSIESPNHGESAVINQEAIQRIHGDSWPTRTIASAAHAFLTAGTSEGARVDFSKRRLVGIGHSIGAAALFLTRDIAPRISFHTMIAVEPGISIKDLPDTHTSSQMLTAWTWLRRDVWSSRKSAKKDLESSPVHSSWDPRVLELYLKHGLRTHPAEKYMPPFAFNGVTTCLSKDQEAACYRSEHLVVDAMEAYTAMTKEIPVHLVFGTVHDVGNPELQAILVDSNEGRTPVSVSYIEGAGHLAVQQQPEAVADVIGGILSHLKSLRQVRL
ncbi:alpha/beta-hydrolase [Crassisporium funariophilum]|nr:alpha/beta-hydrolase [Crassisporium funariophilum]